MSHNMIPLTQIIVPEDRVRDLDEAWAYVLAADVVERGLLHPISVRDIGDGRYKLVSGLHRLEAHKLNQAAKIEVIIRDEDETQSRLTEIMENMIRNPLTAFARAQSLYEIDKLYKSIYPEMKSGYGDQRSEKAREERSAILALRSETLDKVGLGRRAYYNGISIYKGLSPATRARLRDDLKTSWLIDHQAQLQALAGLKAAKQADVLKVLFPADQSRAKATNVADALELLKNGKLMGVTEKKYAAITRQISTLDDQGLEAVFAAHETRIVNWLKSRGSI